MKQKNRNILFWVISIILVISIIYLIDNKNEVKATPLIFGVNSHEIYYPEMTELNLTFARSDLQWSGIEINKGFYDFSNRDRKINTLLSNNISILGILDYGNALYENIPQNVTDFNKNSSNRWKYNYIPSDNTEFQTFLSGYGQYVYHTVLHFKGKITYFECWNEPYVTSFWYPQPDAVHYTELLKVCYTQAKLANPNAIILADLTSISFTQTMYQYGAKDYFDIISFHPYSYSSTGADPSSPNNRLTKDLNTIRSIAKIYGDREKDVWITEDGYPTSYCDQNGNNCNPTGVNVSLNGQAVYINQTFEAIKKMPYIKAVLWYQMKDSCTMNDTWNECNFGLVASDGTKKLGFYAYQEIIKNWNK